MSCENSKCFREKRGSPHQTTKACIHPGTPTEPCLRDWACQRGLDQPGRKAALSSLWAPFLYGVVIIGPVFCPGVLHSCSAIGPTAIWRRDIAPRQYMSSSPLSTSTTRQISAASENSSRPRPAGPRQGRQPASPLKRTSRNLNHGPTRYMSSSPFCTSTCRQTSAASANCSRPRPAGSQRGLPPTDASKFGPRAPPGGP